MHRHRAFVLAILLVHLLLACSAAADPFEYSWQQVAPDVWAGIRQDPFELPQEGNSVFVVTSEGVVVFDAGGSPRMGASIVAKVRSVTDKPITHVVISHWHGDHMRGLQSIVDAYPHVAIYAHPCARDFIASSQEAWLKRRVAMVPNIRVALDAALKNELDLQGRPLTAQERTWLTNGRGVLDQLDDENHRTAFVVPNVTFTDRLVLHLGGRELQFIHPGNAHTAGDVVLWLPQEKVLATGDIVTAPIPLMPSPYTDSYPAVLETLKALQFRTLVPGHGAVQHDVAYVDLLIDTFRTIAAQTKSLIATGASKEDVLRKLDYSNIEPRFTHGDPFLTKRFHDYVTTALGAATYAVETHAGIQEHF
ncbi:MAG: MBL fold metallo-hydrolase [Acidobacteria bacterium]|nr:MBL fold metallo-hydrolase [Acidobacteriota bacterium]MBV9474432.1 MBL fold metallo-hydrolase [Acidobacteriota bacterium]